MEYLSKMKIILNVKNTNYSIVANLYGSITIDKIKYVYLHQHDALIQKILYKSYKTFKNFDDFVKTYQDA
jgi:hypothetical protein